MTKRTAGSFAGYDCVKLENDALTLWVTQSVGPRIIGLALQGSANLLAELPDETLDCPDGGSFSFRGGHRLWHAPEDPQRTYIPDDAPVTITDVESGILVTQPIEAQTGIQKSLTITLPGQDAHVTIDHTLHNSGRRPVELAPWAITQLKPGGIAILPQATRPADEYGLLPNRHIVLWPYTHINSPHIQWGDRYVFVEATMESGALKIGFPNPAGWLGYFVEDTLFVKHVAYQPDAAYFDRGSSSECYCNPRFLELETLGPRANLAPGESVTHRETWRVHSGAPFRPDEAAMEELVEEFELMTGGMPS
ncbi:MAG: hypothetical protein WBB22_15570 [Anaerolineae bacterium]